MDHYNKVNYYIENQKGYSVIISTVCYISNRIIELNDVLIQFKNCKIKPLKMKIKLYLIVNIITHIYIRLHFIFGLIVLFYFQSFEFYAQKLI